MVTSWTPTADAVHNEIPQRGVPGEGFTDGSIPTAGQVEAIAGEVAVDIIATVGGFDADHVINPADDEPVTLGDLAHRACALGAASKVEDGFYPEQQGGEYMGVGSTPSQHLYARYQRAIERLQTHIRLWRRGGRPPGGTIRTVPGPVRQGRPATVAPHATWWSR